MADSGNKTRLLELGLWTKEYHLLQTQYALNGTYSYPQSVYNLATHKEIPIKGVASF